MTEDVPYAEKRAMIAECLGDPKKFEILVQSMREQADEVKPNGHRNVSWVTVLLIAMDVGGVPAMKRLAQAFAEPGKESA